MREKEREESGRYRGALMRYWPVRLKRHAGLVILLNRFSGVISGLVRSKYCPVSQKQTLVDYPSSLKWVWSGFAHGRRGPYLSSRAHSFVFLGS